MVSSLDFRPRLFAIEICLSHCVVFYNRKLSLAPPSGQERTSWRNFMGYTMMELYLKQKKTVLTMPGKQRYQFVGMNH